MSQSRVIIRGESIVVSTDKFKETTIEWSQLSLSWTGMSKQFYSLPYVGTSKNITPGVVFVQKEYWDKFLAKGKQTQEDVQTQQDAVDTNWSNCYEIKIDDDFKCGGTETFRFLVLQDSKYSVYQHRYTDSEGFCFAMDVHKTLSTSVYGAGCVSEAISNLVRNFVVYLIPVPETYVIKKDDSIVISTDHLKETTVGWSQWSLSWLGMNKQFYSLPYAGTAKNVMPGVVFIQKEYWDKFLSKGEKIEKDPLGAGWKNCYEIKIDSDFKYGQNNAQTFRFLVLQDPKYWVYQHRYVDTEGFRHAILICKVAAMCIPLYPPLIPLKEILSMIGTFGKNVFGDFLRSW